MPEQAVFGQLFPLGAAGVAEEIAHVQLLGAGQIARHVQLHVLS